MFKKIKKPLKVASILGLVIAGHTLESRPCNASSCWNSINPRSPGPDACCWGATIKEHPCKIFNHSEGFESEEDELCMYKRCKD